jgi:4-hydroxy-2-oxoheptanedioate aldolase
VARRYVDAGADFVLVGADVALLARGSEELARAFAPGAGCADVRDSY